MRISEKIYTAIDTHLRTGVPIYNNFDLDSGQVARIKAALHLYNAYEDNPLLNKRQFLKTVHHRAEREIANDLEVFEYIRSQMASFCSREDAKFIADHYARKLIKIGIAIGDYKPIESGIKQIVKIHHLDKEAPQEDVASHTATLPVVITADISHVDSNKQNLPDSHRRAILKDYGGKPDSSTQSVIDKADAILASGVGDADFSVSYADPVFMDEEED